MSKTEIITHKPNGVVMPRSITQANGQQLQIMENQKNAALKAINNIGLVDRIATLSGIQDVSGMRKMAESLGLNEQELEWLNQRSKSHLETMEAISKNHSQQTLEVIADIPCKPQQPDVLDHVVHFLKG